MRTLSRPMFNMGGPIKQGIMHGIREPYRGGGPTGTQAALVGNPVYPKTGGREHHQWWKSIFSMAPKGAAGTVTKPGFIRTQAPKVWEGIKSIFGKSTPSKYTPITKVTTKGTTPGILHKGYPGSTPGSKWQAGKEVTENIFTPSYLGKTTEAQLAKKIWEGRGWVGKPIKAGAQFLYRTPTASIPLVYMGGKWLLSDGTPAPDQNEINKQVGQHGPFDHTKKKTKEASAAFAKSQREDRVNKYLDMMGYDRSKKLAIADALIDASKIVGERGTLDPKNITQELISPIIQATSKRLDKPEQIREAVGLMTMKAAIEKDLEDPSIKALRLEQLKQLKGGFEQDIGDFILSAKGGKVKKEALEQFARIKAKEYGETFTVVDEGTTIPEGGSGYYMLEDKIFRVVDGAPQQVV